MLVSRWLFSFFSYSGDGKTNLLDVPHLSTCFHQLLGDVQLGAGSVHGIREPGSAAAASGVLVPWFKIFQGDCCERCPYGLPFITESTVCWRMMGRRATRGMCGAFILMDQTWQWQ